MPERIEPETLLDARRVSVRRSIGPFRLFEVLGRGGMGVVYRAAGPDGEPAAVKVLHATLASREQARRFEQEARIRIEHPNVVRVLDAGTDDDGTPFIAFELLGGESVAARLARERPSPAELVRIAREVCGGLAAAHEAGIVHRDLKPANLFVCEDGRIKVLDFGIAHKTDQGETRLTAAGAVLGTPSYLAPEQARGETTIDCRTDIWALGCILYEAVAGKPPFERDTSVATMLAAIVDEAAPLRKIAPTLSGDLCRIVERCLEKDREARWPTVTALAEALGRADLTARDTVVGPGETEENVLLQEEQRVVALLLADGVKEAEPIRRAVEERGGLWVPLVGGRAIGLFGAKGWVGDEAQRAVSAAVEAREAASWMAVSSGRARQSGGMVLGDAVRAAERACRAGLGGVSVDAEVARSLAGEFPLRQAGPGLCEIPARTPSTRVTAVITGVPDDLPLLGRAAELAQLSQAVRTAVDEQRALVVLVTGPAGIGKTRLRGELERSLRAQADIHWILSGRAEAHRRDVAFHLLGSVLCNRSQPPGFDPGEPPSARRSALLDHLREAIADEARARECADLLGELVGVPMGADSATNPSPRDPQLMADRIELALGDYLAGLCERGSVAMLLEDVQWADLASLRLLEEQLEQLAEAPLLVFATARPELAETHPDLFAGRDVIRIEPRGLVASDVGTLAFAIAGRKVSDALVRLVAERTGGNPFFVEQIVRKLAEEGKLDADLDELPLPLTVEAAVQSRLDRLPRQEKRLCKVAAVLGRIFAADGVRALGVHEPEPLLASLTKRGLIAARAQRARTTRVAGVREYQFRSALVAEVAYRTNTDEARADLHRRAAAYLAPCADVDPEEIARHHERGDEPDLAAERYVDAALAAARRGDTHTVMRCSERALDLGLPYELRFEVLMPRADALKFLGRREEQAKALAQALECVGSEAERALVETEQAELLSATGHAEQAVMVGEAAVRDATGAADREALAKALVRLAAAQIYTGRLPEATASLQHAALLQRELAPTTRALVAAWHAQLATAMGDLGLRLTAYQEAVTQYREAGDVRRTAGAESNLADTYNRIGAYTEAEAALRAALESCRRVHNRLMEGYVLANLGYALSMQGRTDEALEVFAEAEKLAEAGSDARLAIAVGIYRARALLLRPVTAEAAAAVEALASAASEMGLATWHVSALAVAARSWLSAGDPAAALECSTRAMTRRDELGSIAEDEAEVFLAHAQALGAAGRPDEARDVALRGQSRLSYIAARITDEQWRVRLLSDVAIHRDLAAAAEA